MGISAYARSWTRVIHHGVTVRLAELMGGVSLFADLADGFPPDKALRTTLLAVEVGRRAGLAAARLRDTFYVNLLRYAGCIAFSHEEAHVYGAGNDIATRSVMSMADPTEVPATLARIVRGIGAGASLRQRAGAIARLLADQDAVMKHARAQCETSLWFARAIGMSDDILGPLGTICERWDGRGAPNGIAGEEIPMPMRLHHLADVAEIALLERGLDGARRLVERRAGKQLDPRLAACFVEHARELVPMLDGAGLWDRYLAAEPEPHATADPGRTDDLARAIGAITDLKSVYTAGHAWSVCGEADRAAAALGLSEGVRRELHRAALLHDVGRAAIPNAIWDKPGPLGPAEWEQVRMHAYYTDRILARAPALRPAARIAAETHERQDASGYHRGLTADEQGQAGRLLAASDVWVAMREARAHRPAMTFDVAQSALDAEARAGRLCRRSVDALLGAATPSSPDGPLRGERQERGGRGQALTAREAEVLVLVARGKSNREIGQLLDISARTVQNHIAHVYDKLGLYSRAGATLYAVEHGLLRSGA